MRNLFLIWLSACWTISSYTKILWGEELPHIICIMADDLGWRDLHCQGNPILNTPALDKLASSGARFTQAYAASPVCSPTRAALITGLAPARLRITQHGADGPNFWPAGRRIQPPQALFRLSTETTTVAERLKDIGYATGFFGKWHLGDERKYWPTEHGFDVNIGGCGLGGPPTYFDPYGIPALKPRKTGEYLTDRLADEVIEFMRREKNRPMFICLWTYNPHYPFEAPEELVAPYRGREGPGLRNPVYGGQIAAVDRAVGRILSELEQIQISAQTLVIFTSDNGGWSGATDNSPLREGKGHLYEGGIRVPLIVRWPRVIQAARILDDPVITMDITATILDAASVINKPEQSPLDGVSLRPLFEGRDIERKAIYFHYPHFAFHKSNRPGSAIRAGQFKLVHYYDDSSTELYDLSVDPSENNNLANAQPEIAESLNNQLLSWLRSTNAGIPTRMSTDKD
jgi:arylsulfatase A